MQPAVIQTWHHIMETSDIGSIKDLLADEVVFHSPVVHTPQAGKALTNAYLTAANHVLGAANFKYTREVISEQDAVLEFTAEIDGIQINGVDMIRWDKDNKIIDFKVMLRPLKAINMIHQLMGQQLSAQQ
ncbi:nuclear transport factor 2 family protein [Maricurvus nonylphenolicus]|uniref:nuclear transport factor 2 family protein n=1 Tax=Maricurvus nonylphenolicus TaxID=1008307 RepID=UPI0036F365BF